MGSVLYDPHIEMFLTAAQTGSFSKAAEKHYISASAVIKQIKLLEEHLEVQLFERTNRGLMLTEAGRALYENAGKVISLCEEVEKIVHEAQEQTGTVLRIGSSDMTPASVLAPFLPKLRAVDPEIRFRIVPFSNTTEGRGLLFNHSTQGIDLVIAAYGEELLQAIHCNALELYRERYCIAVPDCHPLAACDRITPEQLQNETILLQNPQYMHISGEIYEYIQKRAPKTRFGFFDAYDFSLFDTGYSRGQLLLTIPSWKQVYPFYVQKQIEWPFETSVGILYSETPDKRVRRFLEAMTQALSA